MAATALSAALGAVKDKPPVLIDAYTADTLVALGFAALLALGRACVAA